MKRVLALDLEATLVSNAMSQFPRPGLYDFLELCRRHFDEVVLFTAVRSVRARQVLENLSTDESAPEWFSKIRIVPWSIDPDYASEHLILLTDVYKDLSFVSDMYEEGEVEVENIWIVDDDEMWINPAQKDQWIPIKEFVYKEPVIDQELKRLSVLFKEKFSLVGGLE